MNEPASPRADRTDADRAAVKRLLLFFALVYLVEGVGQIGGLIAQPLSFYLKEAHGWTALQVTAFLAVFNFPWIIKPVYGLLSDFVPIFGYRRKTYLIAANIVAMAAYLWSTQLNAPGELVWALQLTAYAMAISSTVCGAVLVENGQRLGESGRFVNQQWLWFNAAVMVSAIVGGQLVQWLPPATALHAAALIVAAAPAAVLLGTLLLVRGANDLDTGALRGTFAGSARLSKNANCGSSARFCFYITSVPDLPRRSTTR